MGQEVTAPWAPESDQECPQSYEMKIKAIQDDYVTLSKKGVGEQPIHRSFIYPMKDVIMSHPERENDTLPDSVTDKLIESREHPERENNTLPASVTEELIKSRKRDFKDTSGYPAKLRYKKRRGR